MEGLISAWRALTSAHEAWTQIQAAAAPILARERKTLLPSPSGKIEIDHVTYRVPPAQRPILAGITFECPPSGIVVVVGPTGAGKSTLLRLMAGLEPPSGGTIRLDDAALQNWDPDQLGQFVGYLPQEVEIGRDGNRLSGGQRQRIGLARAFFGNRKLILLDEPNANLDPDGEQALCSAVQHAKARGAALVIVTHRPRLLTIADAVLLLRDGTQLAFGPPCKVLPLRLPGATPIQKPRVLSGNAESPKLAIGGAGA